MAQANLRVRQQQRQRLIVILILFILLGTAAFYFLVLKQDVAKKAVQPRPLGQVAVPVITKDVQLGARISRNMFRVKFMKPAEVPADAILSVDEFLGRFVTKPLLEGNYIRQTDVAVDGAVGGYSGMAKPGKRLVVLDAKMFPGAIATLRVGDHVDLLAIGNAAGLGPVPGANGKSLADSSVTLQGGGTQPGDPNSQARKNNRAKIGANTVANATAATLVAENAEVMRVPVKGKDTEYLVLQMVPQDAHVTMLMAASNAVMRVVFRPFNDDTRLTQEAPVRVTTRIPRQPADPDAIVIISGNIRATQKPNSKIFAPEAESQLMKAKPSLRDNSQMFSDSGNINTDTTQNNEELESSLN